MRGFTGKTGGVEWATGKCKCLGLMLPAAIRCLAVSLSAVFMLACSEGLGTATSWSAPEKDPLVVNVLQISQQDHYVAQREFAGRVEAPRRSRLGFEFVGQVQMVDVEPGTQVQQGDTLAVLDTRLLDLDRQRVQAQREEIIAQQQQIESDIRRQRRLKTQGLSVGQRLDDLIADLKIHDARMKAVEAELAALELRQEKSRLLAPFDGEVAEVFIDEGEPVKDGQAALLLVESGQREVTFGIPQDQGEQIVVGQMLPIFGAFGLRKAEVKHLRRSVNAETLSRAITLSLPEDLALSDGVIIYLLLPERREQPGFWLPQDALMGDVRGTWSVYAVNDGDEQASLQKYAVEHLYQRNSRVFVKGQLADGSRVVANGLHRLSNGLTVSPQQIPAQTAAPANH